MDKTTEVKLNIGAGHTYLPGFINIDISDRADIALDLSSDRLPFEDNSIDLVFSYHTLEHVPDYLYALSEIYRVLKHKGRFLIGLPYVTSTEFHLVNPYHLHNFNEYSFDFFNPVKMKGSAAESNPIFFEKVFHRFHHKGVFNIVPPPFRNLCRRHLLNVVAKIDFGLIAIKQTEAIPDLTAVDRRKFQREFRSCVRSRVPYKETKSMLTKTRYPWIIMQIGAWWVGRDRDSLIDWQNDED